MTFDEWWKDNGKGLGHLTEDARRIWEAAQADVGHASIWKFASEKANERAVIAERQLTISRKRVARLVDLLKQALPEEMGGTPDLFCPKQGWDEWEIEAEQAISEARTLEAK